MIEDAAGPDAVTVERERPVTPPCTADIELAGDEAETRPADCAFRAGGTSGCAALVALVIGVNLLSSAAAGDRGPQPGAAARGRARS